MNCEIVDKLLHQSLLYDEEPEGDIVCLSQAEVYNFARNIARECAEVAGCNGHVSGFSLGDLILEHFGTKNEDVHSN